MASEKRHAVGVCLVVPSGVEGRMSTLGNTSGRKQIGREVDARGICKWLKMFTAPRRASATPTSWSPPIFLLTSIYPPVVQHPSFVTVPSQGTIVAQYDDAYALCGIGAGHHCEYPKPSGDRRPGTQRTRRSVCTSSSVSPMRSMAVQHPSPTYLSSSPARNRTHPTKKASPTTAMWSRNPPFRHEKPTRPSSSSRVTETFLES